MEDAEKNVRSYLLASEIKMATDLAVTIYDLATNLSELFMLRFTHS